MEDVKKMRLRIIDFLSKIDNVMIDNIATMVNVKKTTFDKTKFRIIDMLNKTSKDKIIQLYNDLELK